MSSSESDDDSAWNEQLLLAVSTRQGMGPSIPEQDRIQVMQKCLDQGADVDTLDNKGNTALHIAVRKGYQDIIEFLLQKGARTDTCNQEGDTAVTLFNNLQRLEIARHENRRVINQPRPIVEDMLVDDARPSTSQEDASPSPRVSAMRKFSDQRNQAGSIIERNPNTDDKYNETAKKPRSAHDDLPQLAGTTDRVMTESQRSSSHETYESTSAVKKTFHGIVCQWKHLMLILHRAWKKGYSFRLATEMDAAEKFDDVVLEYEDGERGKVHRFMQIKHKQDNSKMITAKDLLDATDGEFSILKYFISWRAIRNNRTFHGSRSKEFILCTNIGLDIEGLNAKNIKVENLPTDDLLKVTGRAEPAPPYFYKLSDSCSVLYDTLKFASDVHRLAREIAKRVCKSENIDLKTVMIRRYHAALVLEVIDITEKKFSRDFIENNNLSREGKKFREAFIFHAKEFCPTPDAPGDDVWKFLKESELKLSENFGNTFKLSEPELTHVERFSDEFVKLVNNASEDDVVKIDKRIYRKNARMQSIERVVADNIHKLAGHVLITENGEIKFRQRFLNDDTPLPGNMEEFRHASKTRLGSKFTELKKIKFEINGYKTCTEEELYSTTELPDDNISDDEISGFLNEFVLAVNQPNEQKLGKMIKREVGADSKYALPNVDIIGDSFQNNIIDWLKESGNHSEFLKNEDAHAFLLAIEQKLSSLVTVGLCLSYLEELKIYNIKFDLENTDVWEFLKRSNPTPRQQILKLPSPGQTLLTALRVYQTVKEDERYHKDGSFFFIQLAKLRLPVITEYVVRDFKSFRSHHLLVIDCATNDITRDAPDLWKPLEGIVKANRNKKMILITGGNKDLAVRSETVITIGDLTKDSRQELLKRTIIKFQGHDETTSFEKLLGIPDCGNIASEMLSSLSRIIDQETLTQLIRSEEIPIGDKVKGLYEVEKYYIPRTITGHVVIKRSVLQDPKIPDLFAITSIDLKSLEELLAPQEGTHDFDASNATTLDPIKCRFLEKKRAKDDFKNVCDQNPNRNIHWLQAEPGKLLWKRSHGNITDLMAFEDTVPCDENAERPRVSNFTEDQLMHQAEKRRIVIISDTAGMGKSTVLTHFAEKIKQSQPTSLVIKVELTRHTFVLNEQRQKRTFNATDTDEAVDFLVDKLSCLDTELERKVFKVIIKVTGGAALLFDGFDEISPEYESIVIDLLKALSILRINRLIVTTRPHTSKELEKKLDTFSYHLQPFSRTNQTEFLIAFWKQGLNSSDDNETVRKTMNEHASGMLQILTMSIDRRMEDFAGIPLLTRMVAEIFPHGERGRQIESYLSKKVYPIIDLYRLFVEKKCEVFCKEKQLSDDTNLAQKMSSKGLLKIMMMIHRKLALEALFPEHIVKDLLSCQPEIEEMLSSFQEEIEQVERIGIVTQVINKNPHFVHRSLAEYFAAQFLIDTLMDDRRNEVVRTLFSAEIFLKPQYTTIRAFLNCFLYDKDYASDDEKESWKFNLPEHSDICDGTLYHVAVSENNLEIIRFFLHRFTEQGQEANIDIRNYSSRTPLQMAIGPFGDLDTVKLLVGAGAGINSVDKNGSRPLHYAVIYKDLEIVRYIVEAGAGINSVDKDGLTPLHHAVRTKDLNIVRYMVEAGAGINSVDKNGSTPLHYAAITKNLGIVRYIVEAGACINSVNNHGWAPLHYAVKTKDLNIVRYIVDAGACINSVNKNSCTPLHYAVETEDLNIVTYIVEAGAGINSVEENGFTPLHYAVKTKDLNIVRYIVKAGAGINSVDKDGWTPLHHAVKTEDLHIVRYLVDAGADNNSVDKDSRTPLHYAVSSRDSNIVRYLVDAGAGKNTEDKDGCTLLHSAVLTRDPNIVSYIVEAGAGINSVVKNHGLTPLHCAAVTGDLNIVRYLVDAGADKNSVDKNGGTPLHYAVLSRDSNIVRYLVDAGVGKNSLNKDGCTLLHDAVLTRDSNIVSYIVEAGAGINFVDEDGLTPLHHAVKTEDLNIVRYIVTAGVGINSVDKHGSTPLHYAVLTRDSNIVRYLVDAGAGINFANKNGFTPLHYAVGIGDLNIVWYIVKAGAVIYSVDKDGWTPLHYAVLTRDSNIVRYIVEAGADNHGTSDVEDSDMMEINHSLENRPMVICKAFQQSTLLRQTVEVKSLDVEGAVINSKSKRGLTPLHLAVISRRSEIVQYLLKENATVDSETDFGLTPRHIAVYLRDSSIVRCLDEHGANFDHEADRRLTPKQLKLRGEFLAEIIQYRNAIQYFGDAAKF